MEYINNLIFSNEKDIIHHSLSIIFGTVGSYLFLELAILMNIAKWVYYFMVVKTHRNIRHYEINMDIFAEREGLNDISLLSDVNINKPDFKEI